MKNLFFMLFVVIATGSVASAQNESFQQYYKKKAYKFPENSNIKKEDIFSTYKSSFGFTSNNDMVLLKESVTDTIADTIELRAGTYQQYQDGYKIEGKAMTVISKNGKVSLVFGGSLPNLNTNISNPITEAAALSNALSYVNAPKYTWQDQNLEEENKYVLDTANLDSANYIYDTTRTLYPKGQLVIAKPYGDTTDGDTSKYALCWKFWIVPMYLSTEVVIDTVSDSGVTHIDTVTVYRESNNVVVYINAITGEVHAIDPNTYGSGFWMTVHVQPVWYEGNQDVEAWSCTFCNRAEGKDSRNIHLFDYNGVRYRSPKPNWVSTMGVEGTSAYWAFQKSWDYFYNFHGINGPDGARNEQRIQFGHNTYFDPGGIYHRTDYQVYGGWRDDYKINKDNFSGSSSSAQSIAQLDVIAHEYTHAVMTHNTGHELGSTGEEGAIGEAFCDYFGYIVGAWGSPGRYTSDWANGFGWQTGTSEFARRFDDPTQDRPTASSAAYGDSYFGGDKYAKSGVLRHFLYLITQGGTFNGVTVTGIANVKTDAFAIMRNYLSGGMGYHDLCDRFIDHYAFRYGGYCSNEVHQVYLAWKAVGIDHGDPCCPYDIEGSMAPITGNVTWTSTSNPTGATTSTITVGNDIEIAEGATLTISGITLQMATGKSIKINAASTSSGTGGKLILDHATLTRHNSGCDASNNTWGGIRVCGNSSYTQGDINTSAQGTLNMNYSTISYADRAVQTALSSTGDAGGIAYVQNSTFYNNGLHVNIWPYHNMVGGVENNATYLFRLCTFTTDNGGPATPYAFMYANTIKGARVLNCTFNNNTSNAGLDAVVTGEASITITGSVFNKFKHGVYDFSGSGTRTMSISGNTFNDNNFGVYTIGGITPYITSNTFNIPAYTGGLGSPISNTTVYTLNDQNVGVVVAGTSGYTISSNTFKTNATGLPGYRAYTTGTIMHNTGSMNNSISSNTFTGVGVAMLSNFKNNNSNASSGLKYLCNKDTRTGYDIAVCGNNSIDGGIARVQASGTLAGAGNTFGTVWNIYNKQKPIDYYFNSTAAGQTPVSNTGVTLHAVSADACGVIVGHDGGYPPYSVSVLGNYSTNKTLLYGLAVANVSYYMMKDTARDSVYYWAEQMASTDGDLIRATLLIEDGLTEAAGKIYDDIMINYELDDAEMNEYVLGRYLIDLLISKRNGDQNMYSLDSNQVDSLEYVVANTSMWANERAQSWLHMYDGRGIENTLLYPAEDPAEARGPNGVLALTEISNGPEGSDCEYVEMIVANCGEDQSPTVNITGWIIDDNAGNFYTGIHDSTDTCIGTGHYRLADIPLWQNVPVGSIIVLYNHDNNCYNLPESIQVETTETGQIYWVPVGGTEEEPYGAPYVEIYTTLPNALQGNYCNTESTMEYTPASEWMNTIGLCDVGDAIQVRCPGCDSLNPDTPAFYHGIGYGPEEYELNYSSIPAGPSDLGGPVKYGTGAGNKFVFIGNTIADLGSLSGWDVSAADNAADMPVTLGNVPLDFMHLVMHQPLDATPIGGGTGIGGTVGGGGIGGEHPAPAPEYFPCCGVKDVGSAGGHIGGGGLHKGSNPSNGKDNTVTKQAGTISVYPNPANTMLYFQFPVSGKTTIRLMDVSGRVISEQVVSNTSAAQFNVKDFAEGMYMYQVITDGITKSGKIVIQK